MKKSIYSIFLSICFIFSIITISTTTSSCSSNPKYNKPRNGGAKIRASGKVGNRKHKNSHVWGK